jgi:hypothetical protein
VRELFKDAAVKANFEMEQVLALLVQKYVLYWFKSACLLAQKYKY